ncbi:MAG TPA: 3-phosphoserine/phosphohydroxythreonine transaminase, partial [Gammaproteobacteria bacterium]|nr:3-phosphoserine/phosphohydroxythreonine transaminase [Gammaproteobacteria bacterium]
FSSGPAVLPAPVMEQARAELRDYAGSGLSILETGHRTAAFADVVTRCESDLRALLAVPDDYGVLFLQGGASLQFVMVALNLSRSGEHVAYADTGHWSGRAIVAARELRAVDVVATGESGGYLEVPQPETWRAFPDAAYLHYTPNETIDGVEFDFIPEAGAMPLVADMSSTILSRPIDVTRFGLIYAGAQKNLGPTGLTLVVLRRDVAARAGIEVPSVLRYRAHLEAPGGIYNTPPTFTWYLIGLYLAWVRAEGGLEEMQRRSQLRSDIVYRAIDESGGFYRNRVAARSRSRTNIPFGIADPALETNFLQEADAAGLKQLVGHRSRGAMRASFYNAMPISGAEALAEFMREFARRNG